MCALDEEGVSETLEGKVGVSEDHMEGLLVGTLMDEPLELGERVPPKGGV